MRSNTSYIEEKEAYTTFRVIESRRKSNLKEKAVQKLLGFGLSALGVIEIIAGIQGWIDEGGMFIFALPVGLYLVFKNEIIL